MENFIIAFAGALGGSVVVLIGLWLTNRTAASESASDRSTEKEISLRYEKRFAQIEIRLTSLDVIANSFANFKDDQLSIIKNRFSNDKTYGIRSADKFLSYVYGLENDIKSHLDGNVTYQTLSRIKHFKRPDFLNYHFFDSLNTRIGNKISDINDLCEDFSSDLAEIDFEAEVGQLEKITSLRDQLESIKNLSEELLDSLNALHFDEDR